MFGSLLVYAGVVLAFVGLVLILKPLRLLRIRTRATGAWIVGFGVVLIAFGFTLPARERRIVRPSMRLDESAPVWQFSERHSIHVAASPNRVFAAIKAVRADEILLFRTLTWIRRFGQPLPESILNPSDRPLLEVATSSGFLLLAEESPRELVIGTIVVAPAQYRGSSVTVTPEIFRSIKRPGFAIATMNFLVEPDATDRSIVSTETRVFATDNSTTRRFAPYWRVIYPGSAIIRRMWLRAIKLRAETLREESVGGAQP